MQRSARPYQFDGQHGVFGTFKPPSVECCGQSDPMSSISVSIHPVNAGLLCAHVYMDSFSLCGVNRVLQRQPSQPGVSSRWFGFT
jgi:hypothetical protein